MDAQEAEALVGFVCCRICQRDRFTRELVYYPQLDGAVICTECRHRLINSRPEPVGAGC